MPTRDAIDRATVEKVAGLAHLRLEGAEIDALARDLGQILEHVRTLDRLDTTNVVPTTHAIDLPTAWREDAARPGLPTESGLANAPERIGDGFGVPQVIE